MPAPAPVAPPAPAPARRHQTAALGFLAAGVLALFLFAIVVRVGGYTPEITTEMDREGPAPTRMSVSVSLPPVVVSGSGGGSEVEAVARASPSIVLVTTSLGSGSGVVLTSDGHVLTNHHVVSGARKIEVVLADGRRLAAQVVKSSEAPDLALLRAPASGLAPATWADSDRLSLGQTVLAIGYSLGLEGEPTVSRGIVSALRSHESVRYIQTDAAVNPGNSGGPLLDLSGSVVGINTMRIDWAGASVVQGMNFAIAGNEARGWVEQP